MTTIDDKSVLCLLSCERSGHVTSSSYETSLGSGLDPPLAGNWEATLLSVCSKMKLRLTLLWSDSSEICLKLRFEMLLGLVDLTADCTRCAANKIRTQSRRELLSAIVTSLIVTSIVTLYKDVARRSIAHRSHKHLRDRQCFLY
jgi:hypothetical protein